MSDDNSSVIGRPLNRVDGKLKVTGRAPFAAEYSPERIAHAAIVQSTIASGRIARLDTAPAERAPGVIRVITYRNAPALPQKGRAAIDPPAGRTLSLLQDDVIHYNGEPIAVVVADTFEHAVDGAARVQVAYAAARAELDFERARGQVHRPQKEGKTPTDKAWGDVDAGMAQGEVRVDAVYSTPMEHHNPMEPHATVAEWNGDRLTVHDATQYVSGVRETLAKTLGIPVANVRVLCPFVGGGFGCKGSAWSHVALAAIAAKATGRPVKLVLARPQMFGPVGGRPQTRQHVVLAAARDGRLTAIRHDVVAHTSRMEDYLEGSAAPTRALYACSNGATTHRLATLDVGVPTFQRAPGEATGSFAIDSAMDELAYALGMDPLALRLVNYADNEPSSGKPWSSKRLRECYRQAAERFGWSRRDARPRSMRDGEWLVGWGLATPTYPAHRMPASALARMRDDGTVLVQSGSQDLGTGTYTVMTQVAAAALAMPVERIHFELGDTDMPKAPVSGGSMTVASVGPAVRAACEALRDKLIAAAITTPESRVDGLAASDVMLDQGFVVARGDTARREACSAIAASHGGMIEALADAKSSPDEERYATRSFGALFAEVRVHAELGVIRVPRIVATYSVGRILNAKTGLSQFQGGIVWGVSQALFEDSLLDPVYGRFANSNLAEYHVPVNADIGEIDVTFVDEDDTRFNPVGARGIGEIGITGVAAALANAVYHATGKRIRALPITLDKLA